MLKTRDFAFSMDGTSRNIERPRVIEADCDRGPGKPVQVDRGRAARTYEAVKGIASLLTV